MEIKLITDLPHDFSILESESKLDGFNFLEKMRLEWLSGKNLFNKKSEALYGIFENDKLLAIGGIKIDPYSTEPSVGRVRHLYVSKSHRKHGLGSRLLKEILKDASNSFSKIRLRTDTIEAAIFYEKLGFKKIIDESASHQWIINSMTTNQFEIFKEITIGGLTKEQLLQQLSDAGIQFNKYAHILFDHPQFSPPAQAEQVKLVKVTLSTLGLADSCSFEEFSNRSAVLGLKLCPLYLAAFLRLSYLDQPAGPYLTIASVKPEEDENYPNGLYLRNFENVLWLRGYRSDGFADWPSENEFIFMK